MLMARRNIHHKRPTPRVQYSRQQHINEAIVRNLLPPLHTPQTDTQSELPPPCSCTENLGAISSCVSDMRGDIDLMHEAPDETTSCECDPSIYPPGPRRTTKLAPGQGGREGEKAMEFFFRASCGQALTRNPVHGRAILALTTRVCRPHSSSSTIIKHHGPECAAFRSSTCTRSSDTSGRSSISTSALSGSLVNRSVHEMAATARNTLGSAGPLLKNAERRPTSYGLGRGIAVERFSTFPSGLTPPPPPPPTPPPAGSTWSGGAFKLVGAAVLFAGGYFGAQLLNRAGSSSNDVSATPVAIFPSLSKQVHCYSTEYRY